MDEIVMERARDAGLAGVARAGRTGPSVREEEGGMSTRTGFPRMDWDTGFLADPKFLHLRDLLPDPVRFGYAGFCYVRLAADAWRTCERHLMGDIVRGIEADVVEALRKAGLLDETDRVVQATFDKWIGEALEAREVWKDRQRTHRASRSVTESHGDSQPARAIGRERTVEPVGQVGTDGEVQEGEAAVFAFLAQHGAAIRPDAPLGRRLLGLVERRGAEAVMTEAVEMTKVENVMSDRQWVLGLENGLEAIPSGRKTADEAVQEETQVRNDARYQRMVERRLEWYRQTGKWPADWGPMPEGSAA